MIAEMKAAVNGDNARFEQAKTVSVDFRMNRLTPTQYVQKLAVTFGGVRNMQGFFGDMVALMPDPHGTVRTELQQCYSQMLAQAGAAPQRSGHGHMPPPGQIAGSGGNGGGAVGVGAPGLMPGQDPLDQLRAFMGQQQRQAGPSQAGTQQASAQQIAQRSQVRRMQNMQQPPPQQQVPQVPPQQQAPQPPAIYDAVVIGAGAAGIAAAASAIRVGTTQHREQSSLRGLVCHAPVLILGADCVRCCA